MARFYLDEQIEADLTALLIQYGHDALHTHDAGNDGAPDTQQLLFAANAGRILVTLNSIVRCSPSFLPPLYRPSRVSWNTDSNMDRQDRQDSISA